MCSSVRVLPDCSKLSVVTVEPPAPVSALLSHENAGISSESFTDRLTKLESTKVSPCPPSPPGLTTDVEKCCGTAAAVTGGYLC